MIHFIHLHGQIIFKNYFRKKLLKVKELYFQIKILFLKLFYHLPQNDMRVMTLQGAHLKIMNHG